MADYTPHPESKIAKAITAMGAGPMTATTLGKLLSSKANNIGQMLRHAIESDLVVRLQDESGLLHYGIPEQLPVAGFSTYHGPSDSAPKRPTTVDPMDPFGLAARKAGADAFASRVEMPPAKAERTENAIARAPYARREKGCKISNAVQQNFEAALISTGHLSITVGSTTVRLTPEHQRMLAEFTSKFSG